MPKFSKGFCVLSLNSKKENLKCSFGPCWVALTCKFQVILPTEGVRVTSLGCVRLSIPKNKISKNIVNDVELSLRI